jgi:hypothetical protein
MMLGLLLAVAWFEAPHEIERQSRAFCKTRLHRGRLRLRQVQVLAPARPDVLSPRVLDALGDYLHVNNGRAGVPDASRSGRAPHIDHGSGGR